MLALSDDELRAYYKITKMIEHHETGNLYKFLFPTENIKLEPGVFPATHKVFEDTEIIYSLDHYPKHKEFWSMGSKYQQRLFRAGNRVGKTLAACLEVMFHVTGLYPEWWEGKRFTTCNDWWVVGVSQDTIIKILQPYFLGKVGDFGTGLIPRDRIDFASLSDVKKADSPVGSFRIKHVNGTYSSIAFKSYEQGWETFQGTAVSVLLDEEPPVEIYQEALMRTTTGGNIMIITFTPLKGITPMINSWFPDGDGTVTGDMGNGRWVSGASMDDVLHLNEEKIENILAAYPTWQRTARRHGFPTMEEGAIFPYEQEQITVEPFSIPEHWPRAFGMDTGNRTTAIWVAKDPESGIRYAYSEHYGKNVEPVMHASAIKSRGEWITGAMDTAGNAIGPTDLQSLFQIYHKEGLKLVNANKSVTSGIYEMQTAFQNGTLKIFSTLTGLLKEISSYHLKEDKSGKVSIVKVNDDRIDALRYCLMTQGIFKTKAEAQQSRPPLKLKMPMQTNNPNLWQLG